MLDTCCLKHCSLWQHNICRLAFANVFPWLWCFPQDKHKPALATIFSIMHKSVSDFSNRMLNEMRRHNYVTPTNYLELVSGYKK